MAKRRADLARMEDEWRRWQAALLPAGPGSGGAAAGGGVRGLAAGLHAAAADLDARLNALGATSGRTVLHGDFKTANLFFQPAAAGAAARVCPCDFQWAGTGVCMQDVAYLLWTSVAPEVVAEREEELLWFYREELRRELAAAGVSSVPADCELREQYEVCPPLLHPAQDPRTAAALSRRRQQASHSRTLTLPEVHPTNRRRP